MPSAAAQNAADDDADETDHQRVAGAEDDAAQDVAAGRVGAEPVRRARRLHHLGEVGVVGIVGRDEGREDCRDPHERKEHCGHRRHPVVHEASPHAGAARQDRLGVGRRKAGRQKGRLDIRLHAHERCTLGSR